MEIVFQLQNATQRECILNTYFTLIICISITIQCRQGYREAGGARLQFEKVGF